MTIIVGLQTMEGNHYLKTRVKRSSITFGNRREKPPRKLKFNVTWVLLLKKVSFLASCSQRTSVLKSASSHPVLESTKK
jgi:hypothetical protein